MVIEKEKLEKIIFNFADDFNVYLNEGNHTNEVSMMTEWKLEHWNLSLSTGELLEAAKLRTNSFKLEKEK